MAYLKGTYKEVKLKRFYAPRFWPGVIPEGEDLETLQPDYDYFLNKDAWSEDEIFGLFAQDNSTALQDEIRCSVRAGKLMECSIEQSIKHRIGDVYYFAPFDIITWAISKGLNLPAELIVWHKQESNKSNSKYLQAEAMTNGGTISKTHYNHILKKDIWHELEIKAVLKADSSIYDLLRAAIAAKTLIPTCTVQISEDGASVYGFKTIDVIEWAKSKGYQIPDELKVIGTATQTEAVGNAGAGIDGKVLSKLEKQQAAILKAINAKQFNPMAIPDNEKGTIKIICESDNPELFEADTAFDRAWKHGIKKQWKMENHNSYAHRGNN